MARSAASRVLWAGLAAHRKKQPSRLTTGNCGRQMPPVPIVLLSQLAALIRGLPSHSLPPCPSHALSPTALPVFALTTGVDPLPPTPPRLPSWLRSRTARVRSRALERTRVQRSQPYSPFDDTEAQDKRPDDCGSLEKVSIRPKEPDMCRKGTNED